MNTTSLGTMVVYLVANASQYQRAMKEVEMSTAASMEQAVRVVKYSTAAIAASLAGVGIVAVKSFSDFDKAMVNSLAIMENVSADMRRQMEEVAFSVGNTTTTSATEAAEAYRYLGSAGLTAAQAMKALPEVAKFAAASNISAESATSLLTRSVAGLGLASQDANEYQKNLVRTMDVLTTAANVADGDATDYAISLRTKVGGALRLLNKDMEEGVAVLMAYGKQGILAENAGEQLAQVMRDLQIASIKNKDVWAEMNLAIYDASGNMLPMADIIGQLETQLGGLSDEQRRTTLTMLGFQDRSVSATQALLGTSKEIREYERQLRAAGGATQEVADKQLTSFSAQMKMMGNQLNVLLIKIGQDLVPIINQFIGYMKNLNDTFGGTTTGAQKLSDILQTGLLVAMMTISDVIAGWKLIAKGAQVVLAGLFETATWAFAGVSKSMEDAVNTVIIGLNKIIRAWAQAKADFTGSPVTVSFIDEVAFAKSSGILQKSASDTTTRLMEEFAAIVDAGRPSVQILKDFETQTAKTNAALAQTAKTVGAAVVPAVEAVGTAIAAISPEAVQLRQDIAYPFEDGMKKLEEYNKLLGEGKIYFHEYNRAVSGLNLKGPFLDPLEQALNTMPVLDEMLKQGILTQEEYISNANNLMRNSVFTTDAPAMTGMQDVDNLQNMAFQQKLIEEQYAKERSIILKNTAITEEERTRLIQQYEERLINMRQSYLIESTKVMLGAIQSGADSMASAMKDAFGEQSGAYKAFFMISKAAAIAQATISMYTGMANAMALPYPANIAAYAQVAASMGQLISGISAVVMSFEGGGHTGNGPRSGGMDGKGGFMAMIHPKERIIDETMEGETSGGYGAPIYITQTFTGGVTERDLAVSAARTKQETMQAVIEANSRAGSFRKGLKR